MEKSLFLLNQTEVKTEFIKFKVLDRKELRLVKGGTGQGSWEDK